MKEESNVSYFAVIPANVRYDEELTDKAKLLYGEITSLSNKEGYCFASNGYFARLYKCTNRAIQNSISKLEEKGYIYVVIEENYKRKIYISANGGYEKNFIGGYEKIFTHNNINNNKIDSLFNYIINKEEKIPKEFEKYESEILDVLDKYEMLYNEQALSYMRKENIEKVKTISYCLALLVRDKVSYLLNKVNREQIISLFDECKIREQENKNTENEIKNFTNYYYKSLKGQLLKGNSPSFFMPKKMKEESITSEKDEEGEEL